MRDGVADCALMCMCAFCKIRLAAFILGNP